MNSCNKTTKITPGIPKNPTIKADSHDIVIPGIKICKTHSTTAPTNELTSILDNNFTDFPKIFSTIKISANAIANVTIEIAILNPVPFLSNQIS